MKLITLTQGKFAKVDDEDFEYLNQFKWFASKGKYGFYASRNAIVNNKQKTIRMHRIILNTQENKVVNHKDHDGLNNQKNNIENCSYKNNNTYRRKIKKFTSQYLGVSFKNSKVTKKLVDGTIKIHYYPIWVSQIKINGKVTHIKDCKT